MTGRFPKFEHELVEHAGPGYHVRGPRIAAKEARSDLATLGIDPPEAYLSFLENFGPGKYFAGALVIYPVCAESECVLSLARDNPELLALGAFPIGYDGTTEGCYCLSRVNGTQEVSWFRWSADALHSEAPDFEAWIEAQPAALFRAKTYAAYREPRDPASIAGIVEQRGAVDVRLLDFGRKTEVGPGMPAGSYPRHHRLVLGVTKRRAVDLRSLTIHVLREGSEHGERNVDLVTLDISGVPVGVETVITAFSFDAFNRDFERITIRHDPEIDLRSPRRVRFAEISPFL